MKIKDYVLISSSFFLLCFFIYFLYKPDIEVDKNNCRADGELSGHTIVIVDQSDTFTNNQISNLKNKINKEVNKLKEFEKITIVSSDKKNPLEIKEWFSSCLPPQGYVIFGRSKDIKEKWKKSKNKFDQDIQDLLQKDKAEFSPIIEMIRIVSRREDFSEESVPKRKLLIVSDMLQNSKDFSFYTQRLDWQKVKKFSKSQIGEKLKNVNLEMCFIERFGAKKNRDHKDKWVSLFEYLNTKKIKVRDW